MSEIVGPFGKARGSVISKIFGAGGATKNLADFWSRGPCLRSDFPRDLSLFGCSAEYTHRSGTENQNLLEFRGWPYLSPGFMRWPEPPRR